MLKMKLELKGIDEFKRKLEQIKRDVPAVAAKAVNDAARTLQQAETAAINRSFDKPNRFTQNAVGVKWANASTLTAEVFIKPLQYKYLAVQIEGGKREQKISEKKFSAAVASLPALVPSKGVKLDAYGNIPKAAQVRILAEAEGRKPTATGKKRRTKLSGAFVIKTKAGEVVGIFKRTAKGLEPLMLATKSAPRYRKRYDFAAVAEKSLPPSKLAEIVERRIARELLKP